MIIKFKILNFDIIFQMIIHLKIVFCLSEYYQNQFNLTELDL